jgi:hypothetical protein
MRLHFSAWAASHLGRRDKTVSIPVELQISGVDADID